MISGRHYPVNCFGIVVTTFRYYSLVLSLFMTRDSLAVIRYQRYEEFRP